MTRGRCDGECRLITAVVRDMGKADDEELAGIRAAVSDLLGRYQQRMGGDLVTSSWCNMKRLLADEWYERPVDAASWTDQT
jgi:hypothetical protein